MDNGKVSKEFRDKYTFDHMVPYRLVDGVWKADLENKGRFVLFHSSDVIYAPVYMSNKVVVEYENKLIREKPKPEWRYILQEYKYTGQKWTQPIHLDKEVLSYRYIDSFLGYKMGMIYLPKSNAIYAPIKFLNKTYAPNK